MTAREGDDRCDEWVFDTFSEYDAADEAGSACNDDFHDDAMLILRLLRNTIQVDIEMGVSAALI